MCDHVSILIGRVLNQKVDRLCAEAEGIFIRPKVSIFDDALGKSEADGEAS